MSIFTFRYRRANHGAKVVYEANSLFPVDSGNGSAVFMASALLPAQQRLTWEQVKAKFEAANPTLRANALGVDEMKATESTAALR